jgi:hypothetical protein
MFHVQKVCVFVLGRYLAHFAGGPEPDRRAAWRSWPQVLQVVGTGPFDPAKRNPPGALFARLRDATPPSAPANAASQAIVVGDLRLRIFPSSDRMAPCGRRRIARRSRLGLQAYLASACPQVRRMAVPAR